MKHANSQITQWHLALQPFKFKLVHRLGVHIVTADHGGLGCTAPRPKSEVGVWDRVWSVAQLQGRGGAVGSRCGVIS